MALVFANPHYSLLVREMKKPHKDPNASCTMKPLISDIDSVQSWREMLRSESTSSITTASSSLRMRRPCEGENLPKAGAWSSEPRKSPFCRVHVEPLLGILVKTRGLRKSNRKSNLAKCPLTTYPFELRLFNPQVLANFVNVCHHFQLTCPVRKSLSSQKDHAKLHT